MKTSTTRRSPRKISVQAVWGNDDADATASLSPAQWRNVCEGTRVEVAAWSWYEGKRERVKFSFNHPSPGDLAVRGDEADHFLATIEDALINGAEFPAKRPSATEFEVSESGTLTMVGVTTPETRAKTYGISPLHLRNATDLIQAADECTPFAWHLHGEYQGSRDRLERELNEAHSDAGSPRKVRLLEAALATMPDDPEEGAYEWLALLSKKKLRPVIRSARAWFKNAPDWNSEDDYIPQTATGRGAAMAFFQAWPFEDLNALGIDIVEGDRPGSTYFAAELRGDIKTANREAFKRQLDVWFVSEGSTSVDAQHREV